TLVSRVGQGGPDADFIDISTSIAGSQLAIVSPSGLVGIWSVPPPLPDQSIREEIGITLELWNAYHFDALMTALQLDESLIDVEFDPLTRQELILSQTANLTFFSWD